MNKLPADLIRLARSLTKLQAARKRLLKEMKLNEAEIKSVKRDLKALADSMSKPDPFDQRPPMRFEK